MHSSMRPLLAVFVTASLLSACYGKGQQPGDDPTRNDESPGEGRPADATSALPSAPRQPTDVPEEKKGNTSGEPNVPSEQTPTPER